MLIQYPVLVIISQTPIHKPSFAPANMAIDALRQSAARFYGASLSEGQAPPG